MIAGLVYFLMHGLWLWAAAVLFFSALVGWFGKKAAGQ
jgi:hypothetical protein